MEFIFLFGRLGAIPLKTVHDLRAVVLVTSALLSYVYSDALTKSNEFPLLILYL